MTRRNWTSHIAKAASDLGSSEPGLASGRAAGRAANARSDRRGVHPGAVVPRTDLERQDPYPDAARRRAPSGGERWWERACPPRSPLSIAVACEGAVTPT